MSEPITASQFVAMSVAAAAGPAIEYSPHIPWAHLDVGAPFNVILAIAFGALCAVWNGRMEHKGNLIGAFLASFVITLGAVVLIPSVSGFKWPSPGVQAAAGMVLAFTSQKWGPLLFEKALDRFIGLRKSNDQ